MSEKIYNMVDLETIEKLADIVAAKELARSPLRTVKNILP